MKNFYVTIIRKTHYDRQASYANNQGFSKNGAGVHNTSYLQQAGAVCSCFGSPLHNSAIQLESVGLALMAYH